MAENDKQSVFTRADTDEDKMNRVKAGGMIAMGAFLAGGLFQVAWMSFNPRILGPMGMGLFGPMMGWFWVIASILALGVPQTICTFVSLHYEDDFEESNKFLSDGNRLILRNGIVALALVILGGGAARLVGWISTLWYAMAVVLIFSCVMAMLFWGVNNVLNGFQRLDLVSVGNLLFPVGQFIGTVALALLAKALTDDWRWVVVGAVAGLGVGQVFGLAPAIIMLKRTGRVNVREIFDLSKSHGLSKKILQFGGLAAVAMVANAVVQNLTAPLVRIVGLYGMLFGATKEECLVQIGYFSTALIFGMSTMLILGVAIALIPAISEAEGQGRTDLMQEYYTTALQQSFTILAIFNFVYYLYIGDIIQLMGGNEFPAGIMGPLASRMVFGASGVAMLFVLTHLFIGLKKPGLAAAIMLAVLAGQIIGIIGFSYAFRSVLWAGAGFIIPPVAGSVVCLVLLHWKHGLKFPWWTILEPVCCGLPAWALVRYVMPRDSFPMMLAGAAILIAMLGIPLWLLERRRAAARQPA